jgi:hypothetical protein
MSDTAQPFAAADPIADAAAAFKALSAPIAEKPRDDSGRFTAANPDPEPDEIEPEANAEPAEATDDSDDDAPEVEAADEAQPEPETPMPSSWPKEDAEAWNAMPPAARAIVAQREGQRDAAVNQKFQEAANIRKAAEATRTSYAQQLDVIISQISPVAPDPARYRDADGNFDAAQYTWDEAQFRQAATQVNALVQQREAISAQQAAEERAALQEEWQANKHRLEALPDFAPDKAGATFSAIDTYATRSGIAAGSLEHATPAEVEMVWKAMQYDKQQEAKARVAPIARPAAPTVRAGVGTPKAAVVQTQRSNAMARLAKTGSIEDAAFFFKTQSKG